MLLFIFIEMETEKNELLYLSNKLDIVILIIYEIIFFKIINKKI